MFRYVAFVWNDDEPAARDGASALAERLRAASPQWQPALARKGLEVFCSDVRAGSSEPYLLHGGAGVVLGKLFARDDDVHSTAAPLAFSAPESAKVVATAGRRLIDSYWGRYVAFIQDRDASATWVVRDPTGTLPCFTTRARSVDVYFSHMEEGAQLVDRSFSVNWNYVAATLCLGRPQVHETGLNEVFQVLGGECVEHARGRTSRQFYWNPLQIAETDLIDDAAVAAKLLRSQTRDCVHAWASGHRSILHLLSGGLDSSIILACLKDAPGPRRTTCLNFHSPGSNTDERAYAQLAAEGSGCEVLERPRDAEVTLEPLLRVQRSCIPGDYFFYLDGGRTETQVAAEHEATAVFSGYGGDQIFYQARARFAAGDYVFRHGVRRGLFTVALDAARVDRVSVWSVLSDALAHSALRRRWQPHSESGRNSTLVRNEVVQDITRNTTLVHPWFRTPGRAPSGKLWHSYQLLFPADFYNPLGSAHAPEPVAPLFSQPLIELSLRIPTWLLTQGGWDRSMARRAFQHDVPRQIITRRTKGGQEEHARGILVRNMAFARDLLLDGHLVKARILDRARLAEVLSGRPTRIASSNVEAFGCLSAEAWLRQWLSAPSETVK